MLVKIILILSLASLLVSHSGHGSGEVLTIALDEWTNLSVNSCPVHVDGQMLCQSRLPEVFGEEVPGSNEEWSPRTRRDGGHFRRQLISEVMVDSGEFEFHSDGTSGEMASLGMQDAFVGVVNEECDPVDIGGFTICVPSSLACIVDYDSTDQLLGCNSVRLPSHTEFHEFPNHTMLPPGGAILVFGEYSGVQVVKTAGMSISLNETEACGCSLVQVASMSVAIMHTGAYGYCSGRSTIRNHRDHHVMMTEFPSRLPCSPCASDDMDYSYASQNDHLVVENSGSAPTCNFSALFSSDVVACSLQSGQAASIGVHEEVQVVSNSEVPDPYPCVPTDKAVDVIVMDTNTNSEVASSTTVTTVVVDHVTATLEAACASLSSSGCCEPGTTVTYSALISNADNRDICDVSFEFEITKYDSLHLYVGTVKSLFCNINIGNTSGDEDEPAAFKCDTIHGGASQVATFVLTIDHPVPVAAFAETGDVNALISYSPDWQTVSSASTSSDIIMKALTVVCQSGALNITTSRVCVTLLPKTPTTVFCSKSISCSLLKGSAVPLHDDPLLLRCGTTDNLQLGASEVDSSKHTAYESENNSNKTDNTTHDDHGDERDLTTLSGSPPPLRTISFEFLFSPSFLFFLFFHQTVC